MKRRVIDKRIKEKFLMDDAYLNGMARKCGWQATLVYLCLCRHSDKEQECFPSIKLMQEKLGIGRNTVIKGIHNLEKHNVIKIEKERMKNGKWQNNVYILIDKSEWIGYQVPHKDTAPSPSQNTAESLIEQNQVPVEDTKETHIRKHIEGHSAQSAKRDEIAEIIFLFKEVNPMIQKLYGSPPQRKAVERLLKQFGREDLENKIRALRLINAQRYWKKSTTPVQLENNIGYYQSKKDEIDAPQKSEKKSNVYDLRQ